MPPTGIEGVKRSERVPEPHSFSGQDRQSCISVPCVQQGEVTNCAKANRRGTSPPFRCISAPLFFIKFFNELLAPYSARMVITVTLHDRVELATHHLASVLLGFCTGNRQAIVAIIATYHPPCRGITGSLMIQSPPHRASPSASAPPP